MYEKIDSNLDFVQREAQILQFWKDNKIVDKVEEKTKDDTEFTFYDGPPTANGKPHIGHILTRVIKDIIPRYKSMKGYHASRKAGWDTHGLPVELEVEKVLGMDGKQDIEKYGIEPFIKKCKESVWKYKGEWEKMSDRVGYWADMENPYITYEDNYIESEWWALKTIYEKGLLYKGHKIVPYCPRCGTALSSHEVAQGYKDVEERSAVAAFKLVDSDAYVLAWTTTPWTLPSNIALCFHPEHEYAVFTAKGSTFVMAKALIERYFDEYEIKEVKKGKEFEGMHYEPLYTFDDVKGDGYRIVTDEYVTLEDGTGVVHNAPAFGDDDNRVCTKYGLPFIQKLDDRGMMCGGTHFDGVFCKQADKMIIDDLKKRGLLLKAPMYAHSYPFCWRCDTPLLYYARSTWFIKMTAVKDKLLKNNDSINWIPANIKNGRMGNFLENVIDWGLSRERYWGTPLPVWVCQDCGKIHVIGSKAELKEKGGIEGDIELHKPYVDAITFKCDECGGTMKRTPEVIDCWFDSGSMPFAQLHYPFENKELFEKTYPAEFISEAIDQTRGWFYTLIAISTLLFDRAPFKNCIVLGHVNDKNGIKMSKHKGNVVDPWSVLDKQGADAVRWYFYTGSNPWLPSRFYNEAVSEAQRKFLGTLWNTYSFYILYADIDEFDPSKYELDKCALTLMDKWVLSELNSLVSYVDECLASYKITESARAISDFTDKLSNWYVRRCRDRFWGSGMGEDKVAAFMTLYTVLETLVRLSAPYTPFIAESIYQNIVRVPFKNAEESVHLTSFPVANDKYIDKKLEKDMDAIINIAVLGRAARNSENIKNRQPLNGILIAGVEDKISDELIEVISDELNVKKAEQVDKASGFVSYEVKPQLKTLGPKYGKLLGAIRNELATNPDAVVSAVENGNYEFEVNGTLISLAKDDVLISAKKKEGYVAQENNGVTVILDTTITPELIKEGYMREFVSKVQQMRKDSDFNVVDHVKVTVECDEELALAIKDFEDRIKSDVLADAIVFASDENAKEWDVNGKIVKIAVAKL
ncbi:MAG: isoleucine--tRNA ligase [Clostridia bacterium]|nr:isoleucine--tRNA ligase [Clostridia bacterium]